MENKSKKNLLIIALIVLVILNIGSISMVIIQDQKAKKDLHAKEFTKNDNTRRHTNMRKSLDRLKLTPDQKKQMKKIHQKHRQLLKEEFKKNIYYKRQVLQLMQNGKADSMQIFQAIDSADYYMNIINKAQPKVYWEMTSILNKDQLKEFNHTYRNSYLHKNEQRSHQKKEGDCQENKKQLQEKNSEKQPK